MVCRILELVLIPSEGITFHTLPGINLAIAGGQLESIDRDFFCLCGVDKSDDRIICILWQFRVIHGRTQIT